MRSTLPVSYQWLQRYSPHQGGLPGKLYLWVKRLMDVILVIGMLPLWLPLVGLIALFIKITMPGGPIFFIQERTGKNGHRFGMYKFRTMVPDAEQLKDKYIQLNERQWPDFKIKNDPRITPLGQFLRKTSLDELPQLINVLKNEMSLVGPRPTSFGPERYALWHTERLDVQPGLTGLWQIYERGTPSFDERLRLDIAYIELRCIGLDLEILIRTIFSILIHKGAA